MQCNAVPLHCNVVQCNEMQCNAMRCASSPFPRGANRRRRVPERWRHRFYHRITAICNLRALLRPRAHVQGRFGSRRGCDPLAAGWHAPQRDHAVRAITLYDATEPHRAIARRLACYAHRFFTGRPERVGRETANNNAARRDIRARSRRGAPQATTLPVMVISHALMVMTRRCHAGTTRRSCLRSYRCCATRHGRPLPRSRRRGGDARYRATMRRAVSRSVV